MSQQEAIKLFESQKVRTYWDNEKEEWYFSVVDVCNILSESSSKDPGAYWRKLKQRLTKEGSEVVTSCHGLKLTASDGKKYLTESEYAILTNEMTRAWSGMSVREYKDIKGLKKENLRDNMTNLELVLNMLAEVSTTAISKSRRPETFAESRKIAKEGGNISRSARENIEKELGHSIISTDNAHNKQALDVENADAIVLDEKK